VHKFRELIAWQKAMDCVVEIYQATQSFPAEERYGLTGQLRRAAVSIPLNVAEGAGSGSDAEFRRFLHIALRSCYETMTALEIACRIGYLPGPNADTLNNRVDEIAAMIVGLMRSLGPNDR
jgi:four helix bundle protein